MRFISIGSWRLVIGVGLCMLVATSAVAKDAPKSSLSISVENYEQSLDSSSSVFSVRLEGAAATVSFPDERTCYRGRCDAKTLKGTLTPAQLKELWELLRKSELWASFEEKKSTTGRGKFTKVKVHIAESDHTAKGLITGINPRWDKKREGLSKAAQSYRSRAFDVQRKVKAWLE